MTDTPRCLVLGDALLDVIVLPAVAPVRGGDVPAAIEIRPGGQGANVAVRLARRRVPVTLACVLGDDAAGTQVRSALARDGVTVQAVGDGPTGAVVVLVEPGGERTMLSRRAAFAGTAAQAALPAADWTVISGYLLAEDDAPRLAAALAVRPGERVVLGCALPAGAASAWEDAARACRPGLVILNAAEATLLLGAGGDAEEQARRVASRLHARVVVTSPGGAVAADPDATDSTSAATPPAGDPATDTTGAGDALAAGVVAILARGGSLAEALAAGVALGDAVAHVSGAQGRVAGEREATLEP